MPQASKHNSKSSSASRKGVDKMKRKYQVLAPDLEENIGLGPGSALSNPIIIERPASPLNSFDQIFSLSKSDIETKSMSLPEFTGLPYVYIQPNQRIDSNFIEAGLKVEAKSFAQQPSPCSQESGAQVGSQKDIPAIKQLKLAANQHGVVGSTNSLSANNVSFNSNDKCSDVDKSVVNESLAPCPVSENCADTGLAAESVEGLDEDARTTLGNIPHIAKELSKRKANNKAIINLHRVLFECPGQSQKRKSALKLFKGSNVDHKKELDKLSIADIEELAVLLGISNNEPSELAPKIAAFLKSPKNDHFQ